MRLQVFGDSHGEYLYIHTDKELATKYEKYNITREKLFLKSWTMHFKRWRRFRLRHHKSRRKNKTFNNLRLTLHSVWQFHGKRIIRDRAFPWRAVLPLALKTVKAIAWDFAYTWKKDIVNTELATFKKIKPSFIETTNNEVVKVVKNK